MPNMSTVAVAPLHLASGPLETKVTVASNHQKRGLASFHVAGQEAGQCSSLDVKFS